MDTIQLDAQVKNLEIQEQYMKELDSEEDEMFRIYRNSSEKRHSGKRLAIENLLMNVNRDDQSGRHSVSPLPAKSRTPHFRLSMVQLI